jgi:hypothetical protein
MNEGQSGGAGDVDKAGTTAVGPPAGDCAVTADSRLAAPRRAAAAARGHLDGGGAKICVEPVQLQCTSTFSGRKRAEIAGHFYGFAARVSVAPARHLMLLSRPAGLTCFS